MQTTNDILHKNIEILKQQLEEREDAIRKLREELAKLKQKKSNQAWVEQ
tara:strand:+ start:52 stop:198 length:147 start_codon:yes stop_codon:yes gene_type:complete